MKMTTTHLIKMKTSMTTIKHFYQPTGNTCGPTCIYMVWFYLVNKDNIIYRTCKDSDGFIEMKYDIRDIAHFCGTDWIVGTPPDRMENGMCNLGLNYVEYISSPHPYDLLRTIIDSGNVSMLRTITKGVPHWIIVNGYDENVFNVLDPWLGEIKYSIAQLDSIWKVRDYQFFEITGYEH